MVRVDKEYEQQAFLIEPTKLRRLVDKIHERLKNHKDSIIQDAFEVFKTGNRREEITSLDHVLALDNSCKQKITRLVITCSVYSPEPRRLEHEVQVDFGRPKKTSTGNTTVVAIGVRSDAVGWASSTLAEVEEQVERNWLPHRWPSLLLIGLLMATLLFSLSQFNYRDNPRSFDWWLGGPDLDRIEAMLAKRPILSDEDLREVSTMQLRKVIAADRPTPFTSWNFTRSTLFLVVPLAVIAVCAVILLTTCYPRAVFLWGDEERRYKSIVDRRKLLWGIIISVIVVGIPARFFYEYITAWLPQ